MDQPQRASLLGLPRELRDRIYHYVHFNEKPVFCRWKGASLGHVVDGLDEEPFSRHVFRVSRQIHDEASAVLYRENTFGLLIDGRLLEDITPLKEEALTWFKTHYDQVPGKPAVALRRIQKLCITLQFGSMDSSEDVRNAARELVLTVAENPVLRHLTIRFLAHGAMEHHAHSVLQPFKMLRNISSVTFESPSAKHCACFVRLLPECTQYLKGLMGGPMPREYLPRLYRRLQGFAKSSLGAGGYPLDLEDLEEAYKAAEAGKIGEVQACS